MYKLLLNYISNEKSKDYLYMCCKIIGIADNNIIFL